MKKAALRGDRQSLVVLNRFPQFLVVLRIARQDKKNSKFFEIFFKSFFEFFSKKIFFEENFEVFFENFFEKLIFENWVFENFIFKN